MTPSHKPWIDALRCAVAAFMLALLCACAGHKPLTASQQGLVQAALANGATDVEGVAREDGGLQLAGKLEGKQFALIVPNDWNHQAMLFVHGYTPPGTPVEVPADPIAKGKDANGVFRVPYGQGFMVGHGAFDKAGMDVRGAVENTHRLAQFIARLGAGRTYLVGSSMGGNIVITLLDKYPSDFAGAIANCGVVGDWPSELGWINGVRAAYNYFTQGTKYSLPGEHSITRSGVSSPGFAPIRMLNMRRLAKPVYALFDAAKADPGGPESRIIQNIAAVAGTPPDAASFGLPILTSAMGMDDFNVSFGGSIVDNRNTVYRSPHLDAAGNAKLNAGIERVAADPAAVARANQWFKASGRISVPLLSLHNSTDSLVPSDLNESILREAAAAAGNGNQLVQRAVPPMPVPLPFSDLQGLAHCGFTATQTAAAWNDLRRWVETGTRPSH